MTRALVVALLLATTTPAFAKSQRDYDLTAEQIFPTLVRFLRVNEKLKITEKDATSGYVLFELSEEKRTFSGSAELVKVNDAAGHPMTRVVLKIEDRPSYMEESLLDRLSAKLRDEQPAAPAPAPPPAEK